MTPSILPGLQVTVTVSALHPVRPLARSALPDAPVVSDDDYATPRRSPGVTRRAFAALRV